MAQEPRRLRAPHAHLHYLLNVAQFFLPGLRGTPSEAVETSKVLQTQLLLHRKDFAFERPLKAVVRKRCQAEGHSSDDRRLLLRASQREKEISTPIGASARHLIHTRLRRIEEARDVVSFLDTLRSQWKTDGLVADGVH